MTEDKKQSIWRAKNDRFDESDQINDHQYRGTDKKSEKCDLSNKRGSKGRKTREQKNTEQDRQDRIDENGYGRS
jgi:hypothetical protein